MKFTCLKKAGEKTEAGAEMTDKYGRKIDYMRISITDKCNLRCRYCMPDNVQLKAANELLTCEEIVIAVKEAASLGICKIKITGGEPLLRNDCAELISMLKAVRGVESITLTTNGILLSEYVEALKEAGISGINVSLDTIDSVEYKRLTGFDYLYKVIAGIKRARALSVPIKINSVLMEETVGNVGELVEFADNEGIMLRFIELMPLGRGKAFNSVSNNFVMEMLTEGYGIPVLDKGLYGNGPAVYYSFPALNMPVGFISPVHDKFCNKCNRIRLTSTGGIKSCLCYSEEISIREYLRDKNTTAVRNAIELALRNKPREHCFENRVGITEMKNMVQIGG